MHSQIISDPSIHQWGPYSVQSVGAASADSLAIGHNPGQIATPTVDQHAGTHLANLGRMTDRVKPTWYEFNSPAGFERAGS